MSSLKPSEDVFLDKKRDKQGRLRWIKFSLPIKNPKQSEESEEVYAGITLYRGKLKITVAAKALAQECRLWIERTLGPYVKYQKTEVAWEECRYTPLHNFVWKYQGKEVNVTDYPSFDAYLKALGKIHWTAWLDETEYALDGLTPREAAQTEEGRKQLEALFHTFENQIKRSPPDLTRPNIHFIKEQLGL